MTESNLMLRPNWLSVAGTDAQRGIEAVRGIVVKAWKSFTGKRKLEIED
jgi:hypothetical protein